ncbi:MAG: 4Fe-4S dicluster domain-containing protein [Candidatus Bipolaricaulota bacterium]|nr:MAG: 4Fe-4S dicluster domain-containing protein [Candidatus Bipolaricaulota bacterium]
MPRQREVSTERLRERVEEMSGEKLFACYQCGMCSAACPLTEEMDRLPSQVIRALQLGDPTVIESNAMWVCASCFACEVRCPKGVDLAKLMEALRQIRLRRSLDWISLDELPRERIRELPQIALVASLRKKAG